MTIDRGIIGEAAAKLLDDVETQHGDEGTLSAVFLIVAIDNGAQDDTVTYRAYDGNGVGLAGWKAKGLLATVNESIGFDSSAPET